MRRLLIYIASVMMLGGCSGDGSKEIVLRTSSELTPEQHQQATAAITTLLNSCPGIARYWGDLKQIDTLEIKEANLADQRDHGWKTAISVTLKVSERPEKIPADFKAWGNHCYFDVGANPAGVSAAKTACVSICKGKLSTESAAFISP